MPGSLGPAPFEQWVIADPDGGPAPLISSAICLLPMIDRDTWYLFRLYGHYKKAVLLFAGGVLDQPARYLEAMEIIDEALNNGE